MSTSGEQESYNPLDKENLALSLAKALVDRPLEDIPPSKQFKGSGIYVIYCFNENGIYKELAEFCSKNEVQIPLYVGKAKSKGSRKGMHEVKEPSNYKLFNRLGEHRRSLESAGFNMTKFKCRFLVVDEFWIVLAESILIQKFSPIWNKLIDGFGNHTPGSGRKRQKRSQWDELHPGRQWAAELQPAKKARKDIEREAIRFIQDHKEVWKSIKF